MKENKNPTFAYRIPGSNKYHVYGQCSGIQTANDEPIELSLSEVDEKDLELCWKCKELKDKGARRLRPPSHV